MPEYGLVPARSFPLLFNFPALSLSVLIVTLGFYEYVVKRSNILCLMFGMRL